MWLLKNSALEALLLLAQFSGLSDSAAVLPRTDPSKRYSSPWLTAKTQSKLATEHILTTT